mgnify:CR=1 FL=1
MKLLEQRGVIAGFAFLLFGILLGTLRAENYALFSGGMGLLLIVLRCLPPNLFGDIHSEDSEDKEQ